MRYFIIIICVLFLTACGGGGSGGSGGGSAGGGTTPLPVNVLTLNKSSVNFQARQFDDVPTPIDVRVSWADARVAAITVGYPSGATQVDWLDVTASSGSLSPIDISFHITGANYSVGEKTTTIRIAAVDAAGSVINYRDVSVKYTLNERPMIGVDGNASMSFFAVENGDQTSGQTVKLTGDNIDWHSSADQGWITVDTSSGIAPSELKVSVNPSNLSAGQHTGIVTFTDSRVSSRTAIVNITAEVQTALAFGAGNTLDYDLVQGQSNVVLQTLDITGPGVNWTAQASETWVSLGSTSGQADGTLSVSINHANLALGDHSAKITISDNDSNFDQSIEAIVNVTIEPRHIAAKETGVAFASMPSLSSLTRKVTIADNAGESIPWAASSSAAWLSVTASGQTGSDVTLTANPAGLATNTLYEADVTVTSSNASVSNSEIVKVGLWVGATNPNDMDTVRVRHNEIISDPVRPYVYVHKGRSEIDVYNVHTATKENTISLTTVARAGDMAISDDGKFLYVFDTTNSKFVEIDLSTHALGQSWDVGLHAQRITFGRVDTKPIVFVDNGKWVNTEAGTIADSTFGGEGNGNIDVSRNGQKLCKINTGTSPYSLACYMLGFSHNNEELSVDYIGNVAHGSGSNGADVALNADGSRVYAASGAPYIFIGFDTETMQKVQELPANAYPNNVEVGSDDLLYGGIDGAGGKDVWIYNKNGVLRRSYFLSVSGGSIAHRQLRVSGDSIRMITLMENNKTIFVTVK